MGSGSRIGELVIGILSETSCKAYTGPLYMAAAEVRSGGTARRSAAEMRRKNSIISLFWRLYSERQFGFAFAFCLSFQMFRYVKFLNLHLHFLKSLQKTPRAHIVPAALESNCCTKLHHISALKSFRWQYFSRLHSDFKYDMLSFRARCFHRSADLVLTKNPSLNAMWQPLTNLPNWPNDSNSWNKRHNKPMMSSCPWLPSVGH